ncbi:MAG: hypothetical protein BWX80_02664 [Candidatus Hydrogenedentes bacterium ADurb.Bin101]|nr:MAG: hypothetical protein BWX80_02664 [Candidatus Hydrogenedentes bacterium ADurb.Bin101]
MFLLHRAKVRAAQAEVAVRQQFPGNLADIRFRKHIIRPVKPAFPVLQKIAGQLRKGEPCRVPVRDRLADAPEHLHRAPELIAPVTRRHAHGQPPTLRPGHTAVIRIPVAVPAVRVGAHRLAVWQGADVVAVVDIEHINAPELGQQRHAPGGFRPVRWFDGYGRAPCLPVIRAARTDNVLRCGALLLRAGRKHTHPGAVRRYHHIRLIAIPMLVNGNAVGNPTRVIAGLLRRAQGAWQHHQHHYTAKNKRHKTVHLPISL